MNFGIVTAVIVIVGVIACKVAIWIDNKSRNRSTKCYDITFICTDIIILCWILGNALVWIFGMATLKSFGQGIVGCIRLPFVHFGSMMAVAPFWILLFFFGFFSSLIFAHLFLRILFDKKRIGIMMLAIYACMWLITWLS